MERKLQFDFDTTQKIMLQISRIDQFKGEWASLEKPKNRYLKELKRLATIQSIGSSTRIEGATLSDAEVETLLKNLKISKLDTRDEQEVIGYWEVLELISESAGDIQLRPSDIHQLHRLLLKFSAKDDHHRGGYKKRSNQVAATYPDGTTRVVFHTTEPFLTEKEMTELLAWVNEKTAAGTVHPLILTGLFVYEFLSIHPYQDGNGRLSRLLTTLLLMKSGYPFIQYVSLEHLIENRKRDYYQALMDGQKDRGKPDEKPDRWMLFFFEILTEAIEKLKTKLAFYRKAGGYLNDRQRQIFEFVKSRQPVQYGDINSHFEAVSPNTIKKDLAWLVQEFWLEKAGNGRGTVYLENMKNEN